LVIAGLLALVCVKTQRRTESMSQDLVFEAKQVVESVAGARVLTKTEMERLLAVKLDRLANVGPEFSYFEAAISRGPFSRIEVREPNAAQDQNWLVNLFVREGVELPLAAFQRDLIGPRAELAFEPRVPPEGLTSYKVKEVTQSIYYGFGSAHGLLMSVSLHRPSD
jgi:hypothetical protein